MNNNTRYRVAAATSTSYNCVDVPRHVKTVANAFPVAPTSRRAQHSKCVSRVPWAHAPKWACPVSVEPPSPCARRSPSCRPAACPPACRAQSGVRHWHRLFRGGHRQANAARNRVALVRVQWHQPNIDYVVRRRNSRCSVNDERERVVTVAVVAKEVEAAELGYGVGHECGANLIVEQFAGQRQVRAAFGRHPSNHLAHARPGMLVPNSERIHEIVVTGLRLRTHVVLTRACQGGRRRERGPYCVRCQPVRRRPVSLGRVACRDYCSFGFTAAFAAFRSVLLR